MRDKGIDKGLVRDFNSSDRPKGVWKGIFGFRKMFWDYLKKMNVPFSDPCCPEADESDREPVAWDESQGQFVRFDGTDWVAITAFTTTTTTTSTTTTTTAATTTSTTTTTTTAPSDIRLKTNIQPTGRMLKILPEYTWEWNDIAKDLGLDHHRTVGIIAQEALEICPEIVSIGEDGYYRVNYSTIQD